MSNKFINLLTLLTTVFIAFLMWRYFECTAAVVSLAVCLFGLVSFLLVRGGSQLDYEYASLSAQLNVLNLGFDNLANQVKKMKDPTGSYDDLMYGCLLPSRSAALLTQTDEKIVKQWVRSGKMRGFEIDGNVFVPALVVIWALTDESGVFHLHDSFHKPLVASDVTSASERYDIMLRKIYDITGFASDAPCDGDVSGE